VNREAYESIGGWDTSIPCYFSDCDMHDRLKMYVFEYNGRDVEIGDFFDVSGSLDDLLVLYRKKDNEKEEPKMALNRRKTDRTWVSDELGPASYKQLFKVVDTMARLKNGGE